MNQAISETITEALNEIIRVNTNVTMAKLATDAEKELARVRTRDAQAALDWLAKVTTVPMFRVTMEDSGNVTIEQREGRSANTVADILEALAAGFRNNPKRMG